MTGSEHRVPAKAAELAAANERLTELRRQNERTPSPELANAVYQQHHVIAQLERDLQWLKANPGSGTPSTQPAR